MPANTSHAGEWRLSDSTAIDVKTKNFFFFNFVEDRIVIRYDFLQVRAQLIQQEYRQQKKDSLENRFGTAVDKLQKEFPCTQTWKRFRFLRLINRFDGDLNHVEKFLKKVQDRQENPDENRSTTRRERREELKTKYASQLAELESAGISTQRPGIFRQLEKHQGDVNKVKIQTMKIQIDRSI